MFNFRLLDYSGNKELFNEMTKQIKRNGKLILILSIYGFLNYHPQMLFGLNSPHWGWASSVLATVLVLFFMRQRDRSDWKQKLGINFTFKDFSTFLMVTSILLVISYFLVDYLSTLAGYEFKPKLLHYKTYAGTGCPFHFIIANYVYYIPETLNEEMLIGAFLLMGIERKFTKLEPKYIAVIVALLFSLMHQALYKWSPVQSGVLLSNYTILSLFFVGVLRNALILKTRKITYSWAIHLSFNVIFFSGYYIHTTTQKFVGEPERFNIVFGNFTMVAITGMLAVLSMLWLNKKTNRIP